MNNENNQAYPDDNPKTAIGVSKAPLHLVPPACTQAAAEAFADGAAKYGPYNWRDKTVSSSVYIAAMKRHIDAWWDGENQSQDAGVHHLGHVIACAAIILDAQSVGKLNDDRPTPGAAAKLQAAYAERIKEGKKDSGERNDFSSGCGSQPTANTVEPCGVSDLQADLQSGRVFGAPDGLYRDTLYRRVVGYDSAGNRLMSESAIGGVFAG